MEVFVSDKAKVRYILNLIKVQERNHNLTIYVTSD